jgi:AcrR family transcriptional regulator
MKRAEPVDALHREVEGPRRSALLQDRSRQTRRRLVRAAIALWTERGFERGVEDTTVEEIARAAGVTKGTFYFHFAHKEDILLELGWGTAEALYAEALSGVRAGRDAEAIMAGMLRSLARRVESVPKKAIMRAVGEFYRGGRSDDQNPTHFGFARAFALALTHGQSQGLLPADVDTGEIAVMLEVLTMDALLAWVRSDAPLVELLTQRAQIVVAGAREVTVVVPSRRPCSVADDEPEPQAAAR